MTAALFVGSFWTSADEDVTTKDEDAVVGEAGEADGVAEGAKTKSAEDDTAGALVGATSEVVTASTDVAAAVCSMVVVEYGTPSWST